MKRLVFVSALSLIIVFGVFLSKNRENNAGDKVVSDALPSKIQVRRSGAVDVRAVPVQLEPGKAVAIEISLSTHSVELDYDYPTISYLLDNLGNRYKALEWSGGKGGHHLSGMLTFEKLEENAQVAILTISGIDNQDVSFEWQL